MTLNRCARYLKLFACATVIMSCLPHVIFAQEAAPAQNIPAGATQIDATDALEWDKTAQTYTARGAARAQKGNMVITADLLIAHYRESQTSKNDVYQLEAHGNVHIVQGDYTAQGDDGSYNVDKQFYRLTGRNLQATTKDTVITARDSLDYDQAIDRAYARGDAKAVKTNQSVAGDVLTADFGVDAATGKRAMKFMTAEGHVLVTTPQDIVHADHGTYDLASDLSILTGDVKISQGQNQLEGQRAELNMKTGISRLLPALDAHGQKTRVRVLMYQDNQKNNSSTATKPAKNYPKQQ